MKQANFDKRMTFPFLMVGGRVGSTAAISIQQLSKMDGQSAN